MKRLVKKVLAKYDGRIYYRMHVPSGYGKQTLDFEGALAGRAWAVETKAPGEKLSPRQNLTVEEMKRGGVRVFFVDGEETLALFEAWLHAVDRMR